MHRAADSRHIYTCQSHYPDTKPTSPGFTVNPRYNGDRYNNIFGIRQVFTQNQRTYSILLHDLTATSGSGTSSVIRETNM